MNLNDRSLVLAEQIAAEAAKFRCAVHRAPCGARLIDCGVQVEGGLEAGVLLARICMADLAEVRLIDESERRLLGPLAVVSTDAPLQACMASQYAGWEVKGKDFFAMGSGAMRAAAAREPLFAEIGFGERAVHCVGVLEASQLPPDEVCQDIAAKCGVEPAQLTLLVAPTRSQAGGFQVVARSVETALHKLHALKFDLHRVVSGWGAAPLPPPAKKDLASIGRTNDAILYGGRVVLYVRGNDESIEAIGPMTPSSASKDYGRPFGEVLARVNHDFYQVDPLLFSPAQVTFVNLDSGKSFRYGETNYDILAASFGM